MSTNNHFRQNSNNSHGFSSLNIPEINIDASSFLDPSLRPVYQAKRYEDTINSLESSFELSSDFSTTHDVANNVFFEETLDQESEPESLKDMVSPERLLAEKDDMSDISETRRPARIKSVFPTVRFNQSTQTSGRVSSLSEKSSQPVSHVPVASIPLTIPPLPSAIPSRQVFPQDAPVKHVHIEPTPKAPKIQDDSWFLDYVPPQSSIGLWDSLAVPDVAKISVSPSNLLLPNSIYVEPNATKSLSTFIHGLSLGIRTKRPVGFFVGNLRVVQRQHSQQSELVLWIDKFDPGVWNQLQLTPTMVQEDEVAISIWESQDQVNGYQDPTSVGEYVITFTRQPRNILFTLYANCPDFDLTLEAVPTPRMTKVPTFSSLTPEWGYIVTSAGRSVYLVGNESRPVLSKQVSPVGIWIESSGKSDLMTRWSISNRNLRRIVRRAGSLIYGENLSLAKDRTKPNTMLIAVADPSLPELADFWNCYIHSGRDQLLVKTTWTATSMSDEAWTIVMPKETPRQRPIDYQLPPLPSQTLRQTRQPPQIYQNSQPQQDVMQTLVQLFSSFLSAWQNTKPQNKPPKPPTVLSVDSHFESELDVGDSASQVHRDAPSVIAALVNDGEQSFVLPMTSSRPRRKIQEIVESEGITVAANRVAQRYLNNNDTIHEGYSQASLEYLKRWNLLE